MSIRLKFNLVLAVVLLLAAAGAGFYVHGFLQKAAIDEVRHNSQLMMHSAMAIRDYTTELVKPHLDEKLEEKFLPQTVPAYAATETLKRLQPRLYSIASSAKAFPQQVHLTVAAVRYGKRKGVSSTFLAGDEPVVILPSFSLPEPLELTSGSFGPSCRDGRRRAPAACDNAPPPEARAHRASGLDGRRRPPVRAEVRARRPGGELGLQNP